MSYETALEAAGAKILQFKEFGSYRGDWYALVEYNGERGWLAGNYGSCSACDSFQAEFGWDYDEYCDEHRYSHVPTCSACVAKKETLRKRLADFGKTYLDGFCDVDLLLKNLDNSGEWDEESKEAAAWIRSTLNTP